MMERVRGIDVYDNSADAKDALDFRRDKVRDVFSRVLGDLGRVDFGFGDDLRICGILLAEDSEYGVKCFDVDLAENSIRVCKEGDKYLERAVNIANECESRGVGRFFVIKYSNR